MMQAIQERLSATKESNIYVFVDSDMSLVEYYMSRFLEKFQDQQVEVVRVQEGQLYNEASSFSFFQKQKVLKVMHLHEKDLDALSLSLQGVEVLIHAPTSTVLKKIQSKCSNLAIIDNSQVKPWHRATLLANELVGFSQLQGAAISLPCANYFVKRLPESFNLLMQEYEKVKTYCAGKPITREAIDGLTERKSEENFFQLAKQILFSQKVDAKQLVDASEFFSLFVALRYQIYIALNLLNQTEDKASQKVKGVQRQEFLQFLKGKTSECLLRLLASCFDTLKKVREHKIKAKDALSHILLNVHSIS